MRLEMVMVVVQREVARYSGVADSAESLGAARPDSNLDARQAAVAANLDSDNPLGPSARCHRGIESRELMAGDVLRAISAASDWLCPKASDVAKRYTPMSEAMNGVLRVQLKAGQT
jgi:hypothetical protein